ncbi:hypothetical protein TNCV_1105701 [Trichonephila clavipes]|nr:hypothetical protein TNCV_1105701 [Trichonephila clavipes]
MESFLTHQLEEILSLKYFKAIVQNIQVDDDCNEEEEHPTEPLLSGKWQALGKHKDCTNLFFLSLFVMRGAGKDVSRFNIPTVRKRNSFKFSDNEVVGLNALEMWVRVLIRGRGSPVVKVSDRGWPCHEFEPSTTKDPPCRGAMHVKSIESSNVLPLVWWGS